ncbi:YdcF family protein [Calditrichota bacterium GD2]
MIKSIITAYLFFFLIFFLVWYFRYNRTFFYSFIIMLGILVFLCFVSPLPLYLTSIWERNYEPFGHHKIKRNISSTSYIIVLGAGFENDPQLSVTARLDGPVAIRLMEALRCYNLLDSVYLVTSGGAFGRNISQARAVAEAAVSLGVNPADTLQLSTTVNTEDEARSFVARFGKGKTVVIATDAMHMRRAMFWFSYYGANPIPAPTNYRFKQSPEKQKSRWKPSFKKIKMLDYLMDEWIGLQWAKVKSRF